MGANERLVVVEEHRCTVGPVEKVTLGKDLMEMAELAMPYLGEEFLWGRKSKCKGPKARM